MCEGGSGIVKHMYKGSEAVILWAYSHFRKITEASMDEANERRVDCEAMRQERKMLGGQIMSSS